MSPKLRDILCYSILLGSALVSSLEADSLDAKQVHDMVEDPLTTKKEKIAFAKEMVQPLPMEQQEGAVQNMKRMKRQIYEDKSGPELGSGHADENKMRTRGADNSYDDSDTAEKL
ncbi:unnamed protein product [Auanema sp. JU1783]|nr:unnamed protein product [Auanema sp. JU1783]